MKIKKNFLKGTDVLRVIEDSVNAYVELQQEVFVDMDEHLASFERDACENDGFVAMTIGDFLDEVSVTTRDEYGDYSTEFPDFVCDGQGQLSWDDVNASPEDAVVYDDEPCGIDVDEDDM
ncbi:MAG: hypothetical protein RR415_09345 [Ruthenibacterium sp.]